MLIVILGGARSGKSTLALDLARRWEDRWREDQPRGAAGVTMIATAPQIPGDLDLAARIRAHRAERPAHWSTVEAETDLIAAMEAVGGQGPGSSADIPHCAIIDCVTLWVNNLLWRGDTPEQIVELAERTARVAAQRRSPTIVVSNEVGLGVHPATPEGREFRDLLGRVNTIWSAQATRSLMLIAGRILELGDPRQASADLVDLLHSGDCPSRKDVDDE